MYERPAGLILAGGLSRRMGANKALALLGGQPMISHVAARVAPQVNTLAINAPATMSLPVSLPVIADTIPGHAGPLAGILAGLRYFAQVSPETAYMLSVPVDTPFLPKDLTERFLMSASAQDQLILARSNDRLHPVIALWPIGLADDLEHWLANPDHRRLHDYIERHSTTTVDFTPAGDGSASFDPFFNVNHPDDLLHAQTLLDDNSQ